ncbi:hypothetical protein KKK_05740 [Pseudomonas putida B6-2]|nr:hypothetical protein KKK_05740 [Pseudomonas putida B6-2]
MQIRLRRFDSDLGLHHSKAPQPLRLRGFFNACVFQIWDTLALVKSLGFGGFTPCLFTQNRPLRAILTSLSAKPSPKV